MQQSASTTSFLLEHYDVSLNTLNTATQNEQ
jgi:hypothetical protein